MLFNQGMATLGDVLGGQSEFLHQLPWDGRLAKRVVYTHHVDLQRVVELLVSTGCGGYYAAETAGLMFLCGNNDTYVLHSRHYSSLIDGLDGMDVNDARFEAEILFEYVCRPHSLGDHRTTGYDCNILMFVVVFGGKCGFERICKS